MGEAGGRNAESSAEGQLQVSASPGMTTGRILCLLLHLSKAHGRRGQRVPAGAVKLAQ